MRVWVIVHLIVEQLYVTTTEWAYSGWRLRTNYLTPVPKLLNGLLMRHPLVCEIHVNVSNGAIHIWNAESKKMQTPPKSIEIEIWLNSTRIWRKSPVEHWCARVWMLLWSSKHSNIWLKNQNKRRHDFLNSFSHLTTNKIYMLATSKVNKVAKRGDLWYWSQPAPFPIQERHPLRPSVYLT